MISLVERRLRNPTLDTLLRIGRVPKVGDQVEVGTLRFVVESMEDRRIQSVTVGSAEARRETQKEEA